MSLTLRNSFRLFSLGLGLYLLNACSPSNSNSAYFYDALRDTISPMVVMNTPADNATYAYGENISFVAAVTDLEVKNKGGKLKSLRLVVNQVDQGGQANIKELLNKNLPVDGKEGYTLNEKILVTSGAGITYCQAKATATDYSGRSFTDSVSFKIQ